MDEEKLIKKAGYEPYRFRVVLLNYYGNIGHRVAMYDGYIKASDWKEQRDLGNQVTVNEHVFNTTYSKRAVLKKIRTNHE